MSNKEDTGASGRPLAVGNAGCRFVTLLSMGKCLLGSSPTKSMELSDLISAIDYNATKTRIRTNDTPFFLYFFIRIPLIRIPRLKIARK